MLSACLILPLRSTGVSALKRHQSHQAVLKALDVTSQCLVAFDHLLQQYCVEARIDRFHSRKWTQLCVFFLLCEKQIGTVPLRAETFMMTR